MLFISSLLLLSTLISSAPIPSDLSFLSLITTAIAPDLNQHTNNVTSYLVSPTPACIGMTSLETDVAVGLPVDIATAGIAAYCGNYVVLTVVGATSNVTVAAKIVDTSAINSTLALSNAAITALTVNGIAPVSVVWNFATPAQQTFAQAMILVAASSQVASSIASASAVSTPVAIIAPVVIPTPVAVVEPTTTSTPEPAYTPPYAPPASTYTPPAAASTPWSDSSSSKSSSSSSSSSYSSSNSHSGVATYYYQGGVAGACGKVHSDSDYIIAIDMNSFGSGGLCGKSVTINYGGKSIQATIADACESCGSFGHIDLSSGAFNALSNPSAGQIPITWSQN